MYNKNLDISKIESALCLVLVGIVPAANIYPGERPTENPKKDNANTSFIVVSVPSDVKDKTAYGHSLVSVDVYVPSLEKGRKPNRAISDIVDKVFDKLPALGKDFSFDLSRIPCRDLGRDDHSYFVSRITLDCIIKTKL